MANRIKARVDRKKSKTYSLRTGTIELFQEVAESNEDDVNDLIEGFMKSYIKEKMV